MRLSLRPSGDRTSGDAGRARPWDVMSQSQRDSGHLTHGNPDVVLPVRNHTQTLSAHVIEPLANSGDAEITISIGTQRVRRFAIRRLPEDLRIGHGRTLGVEYDAIQNAFRWSSECKC